MNDKARHRHVTWGKRIILTIIVLCGIMYGVLALAERNPDPMRLGFEDYLEKVSGADAQITEMSKVELVPHVAFGMKGLSLRDRLAADKTLLKAGEVYVSLPFWSLLGGGGDYYALQLKKLDVASGFILPKKLSFDFAGISDPDPSAPNANFMAEGTYDGQPVLITAGMERRPGRKFYKYRFANEYPVTFKIGQIEGDGIYERRDGTGTLKKTQIVRGTQRAEFVLRNIGSKNAPLSIEGSINGVEFAGQSEDRGGKKVLVLSPVYAKPDDQKRVTEFLDTLNRDMGYDSDTSIFVLRDTLLKQPL